MSKYDVKQEVTDKFSLRGRVFHKLREDILSGKYQEHEELKEVAIGEEMGVSRTPVREAFRQLELEGLIQIVKDSGAQLVGAGIVIEKGFQPGGDALRDQGVHLESLAIVESMDEKTGEIVFR